MNDEQGESEQQTPQSSNKRPQVNNEILTVTPQKNTLEAKEENRKSKGDLVNKAKKPAAKRQKTDMLKKDKKQYRRKFLKFDNSDSDKCLDIQEDKICDEEMDDMPGCKNEEICFIHRQHL
ncbi:hypothetical protein J6590_092719 [Homalodisca vitripennis]|nr:hypothetical protein J6590_092719 [Homalodisca vitripennis]